MTEWKPRDIPARRPGWEHAYALILEKQAQVPFSWGEADCLTRVADLCRAMTGVNPFPMGMRRYRTAAGAAKQLKNLGFNDVDAALSAVFPEIAKAKARRGDCGVGEVRIQGKMVVATFIVMGAQAVGSNERGPVVVPTLALKRTFKVG